MGMPAARLRDLHVCAMVSGVVPDVGGAMTSPCALTVIIDGLPATRITNMAACAGPPDLTAICHNAAVAKAKAAEAEQPPLAQSS